MKKLSTFSLCFTFTGCFLGAGYVSGQEIYQFFGIFGEDGAAGLVAAVAVLWLLGVILLRVVELSGNADIDRMIVGSDNKVLLFLVGAAEVVMMFGTYFVMIAGAGALWESVTGMADSHIPAGLVFAMALSLIAVHGIGALIRIFSLAVPFLVAFTAAIGGISFFKGFPGGIVFVPAETGNPLLPHFLVGAFAFAAYNYFCSVGVMCPVGLRTKSRKSVYAGLGLGAVLLFAVAMSVLVTLAVDRSAARAELPMLAAAGNLHPVFGYLYAFFLFVAMTGAGLSCLIPTVTYFSAKSRWVEKNAAFFTFAVSFAAFLLSIFGFSTLVSRVFSVFGYLSALLIVGMVRHYIVLRRREKNDKRRA